jgi:putative hydrolase of HD superfamily
VTDLDGIASYLLEVGNLKRIKRTGWHFTGVGNPESIADHSWRVAVIGMILAGLEGADPDRTAALAVLHDTAETRIGDIAHIGRRYLTAAPPEDIVADQIASMPEAVAAVIADRVGEFELNESREAMCAKDADKLDCLVQAVEYQHAGSDLVDTWIQTSMAALKTESARLIGEAVIKADPVAWQRPRSG